ncbi:hypothetical protein PFISCL1PPCAC_3458, partial [Pristionchus fissidentatus]
IYALLLFFLSIEVASSKCVNGVDNKMRLHDLYDGKKDIVFENFAILTYDNLKRPSCTERGGGSIVLPGYFQVISGKVHVKKRISITGAAHLAFNLEKNSMIVGIVCKNGKSNTPFLDDDFCYVDLFAFAQPKEFKNFKSEGAYDIFDIPGDWREMKPIMTEDNPYIEGEWKVSANLNMAGTVLGGIQVGEEWIEVSTMDDAKDEL